jgi:hypothetical protein
MINIHVFDLAIVGNIFALGINKKDLGCNETLSLTAVYFVTEFLSNYTGCIKKKVIELQRSIIHELLSV